MKLTMLSSMPAATSRLIKKNAQYHWHASQRPYLPAKRKHKSHSGKHRNAGSLSNMLAWAGICAVLTVALWVMTLYKLDSERRYITNDALKEASYLSQSYADQLTRSIEQIDQISLHLQHEWRKSGGKMVLTRDGAPGILPLVSHLDAWIADRNGIIAASSRKGDEGRNISAEVYFRSKSALTANPLYIDNPTAIYLADNSVIHFSRQISTAEGSFDGIVAIAAQPEYLESFAIELGLGKNDSVTLKKLDGTILASKRGENIRSTPTIYRTPSVFAGNKGVTRMGAENFTDNEARIVAWQKLKGYPLMAIVNQSEADIYANYRQIEQDYKNYALMGSIMLILFSVVGINLSSRLARKRKQANDIRYTYRLATEAAREGFFTVKAVCNKNKEIVDFIIEDCNDRGADFIGFNKSALIGVKLSSIYINQRAQQVLQIFRNAMETGFYEDELKLSTRGDSKPIWVNRRLVRSGDGLAVTLRDISDAKAHEHELAKLANTDALTSLPNRHWLRTYLPAALEQAKKNHVAIAVLFIDLDNFKNINDTLGHEAGDELLKAVATRLKSLLRPGDNIVRLGGDEFTVLSEGHESNASVIPLAERIIQALNEPITLGTHSHIVGASIGISVFQEDGLNPETLLKHADIAMYEAKNQGKGHFQFYQPHMLERLMSRLDNASALRKAIEMDEFLLYYQPRVSAATGEIRGLEALIRWNHPVRGMVSPAEFIPFAEESSLIVEIGSLVIEKACRQIALWQSMDLPLVPVSVNVSAQQLNQGSLVDVLKDCIQRHSIDASLLEVELTESSMIAESSHVLDQLAAIKDMGIKLAIDDFGTGYSSMSQLQRLDLDVLKIDQSFARSLTEGQEGEAFFMAMISMAHVLNMTVVAEGVETKEQFQILKSLSCDEIQGYFLSRPLPAHEISRIIAQRFLLPHKTPLH